MPDLDRDPVVTTLNRLLEAELAGVVRYTHYSLLVFGFGRIPIVSWLRTQVKGSRRSARTRHSKSDSFWIPISSTSGRCCANRWTAKRRRWRCTGSC